MKEFKIHRSGDVLVGDDVLDAVKNGINTLHLATNFSYSGERVTHFKIEYRDGILGGNGGLEVELKVDFRRATTAPMESTVRTVWIYGTPEDVAGVPAEWFPV
jgi:hypothetical protein